MKKIKVEILLNSYLVPFWSYKMIEEIDKGSYAEINLVVKNSSKSYKRSILKRIIYIFKSLLYVLYRKLDRKLYPNKIDAFVLLDKRRSS